MVMDWMNRNVRHCAHENYWWRNMVETNRIHPFDVATAVSRSPEGWSATTSDDYWDLVGPFRGTTAATILRTIPSDPRHEGGLIALTTAHHRSASFPASEKQHTSTANCAPCVLMACRRSAACKGRLAARLKHTLPAPTLVPRTACDKRANSTPYSERAENVVGPRPRAAGLDRLLPDHLGNRVS